MKIGFLLCLIVCSACTGHAVSSPIYDVSSDPGKRGGIKVQSEGNNTLIEVSSAFGIGSGTVNLVQGQWPGVVIVRLKLKGLEGFTVSNGMVEFDKSDLPVRVFTENGTVWTGKYLLGELGYYEVQLPKSLFGEGVSSITIQWVDFYR